MAFGVGPTAVNSKLLLGLSALHITKECRIVIYENHVLLCFLRCYFETYFRAGQISL